MSVSGGVIMPAITVSVECDSKHFSLMCFWSGWRLADLACSQRAYCPGSYICFSLLIAFDTLCIYLFYVAKTAGATLNSFHSYYRHTEKHKPGRPHKSQISSVTLSPWLIAVIHVGKSKVKKPQSFGF